MRQFIYLRMLLLVSCVGVGDNAIAASVDFVSFQTASGTQASLQGFVKSNTPGGSTSVFSTPIPALQTFDPLGSQPTATLSKIGTVQDTNGLTSTGGAAFSWQFAPSEDSVSIFGTNSSSCSGGSVQCFASSSFTTYFTVLVPVHYALDAQYNYLTPIPLGASESTRAILFQSTGASVTTITGFGALVDSSGRVTLTNPNNSIAGILNPGTYAFQTDTSISGNIPTFNGELLTTMNGSLTVTPVPIPPTFWLMGIGLTALTLLAYRTKERQSLLV